MTTPAGAATQSQAAERPARRRGSSLRQVPRWLCYVVTGIVAVIAIAVPIRHVLDPDYVAFLWMRDFDMYRDATARYIGGGPFYLPEQLGGPYGLAHGHVLYPPPSVLLFVPFVVLPAVLWWLIPLGITVAVLLRLRPHPAVWPLMIAAFAWPPTVVKLLTGNPVMWVLAAVALGRLAPWPSVFVLLKPSLFPFALFGIRHRSWWAAFASLVLVSAVLAPILPSWPEFVQVVRDAREPSGVLYSVLEVPMLLIPLIAGLGRTTPAGRSGDRPG